MSGKGKTPKYAVRLVIVLLSTVILFFVGLQFLVPGGSRLTGSYDAKSLLYIAAQPVQYAGSQSCGAGNCHTDVYKTWLAGAHGVKQEQSKCEVCHGPQGTHPEKGAKMQKVRGDGNVVELCLTCHHKMKARITTGQPQIVPQQHPFPHEGTLICTQCHNPHSPRIGAPPSNTTTSTQSLNNASKGAAVGDTSSAVEKMAAGNCFGCHGAAGRGGFAPVLAGQPYQALKLKLEKYKSGELSNPMMNPVAKKLQQQDIDALAQYFAKLS